MSMANAELFIRTWQDCATTGEVAERLGCTAKQATARAAYFRKKGVPLRRMPTGTPKAGRPGLDVQRLARIARGEE